MGNIIKIEIWRIMEISINYKFLNIKMLIFKFSLSSNAEAGIGKKGPTADVPLLPSPLNSSIAGQLKMVQSKVDKIHTMILQQQQSEVSHQTMGGFRGFFQWIFGDAFLSVKIN
jgi:hypothetical protein